MNDQPTQNNQQKNLVIPMNVPVAIIIAGILVAAAIYFGGARGGNAPTGSAGTPTAVQPAQQGAMGQHNNGEQAAGSVSVKAVTDADHVKGATNAKLTIVEYSDFECPFCRRFLPTVNQALQEYPNDVRLVYRHFPLESIHPNARIAAIGSECAAEQGKFWEYHDYIFEQTTTGAEIAKSELAGIAQAAGVANIAAFTTCLDSGKHDAKVDGDTADAQAAGGRGTPFSVLVTDDQQIPFSGAQPYSALKTQIDSLL